MSARDRLRQARADASEAMAKRLTETQDVVPARPVGYDPNTGQILMRTQSGTIGVETLSSGGWPELTGATLSRDTARATWKDFIEELEAFQFEPEVGEIPEPEPEGPAGNVKFLWTRFFSNPPNSRQDFYVGGDSADNPKRLIEGYTLDKQIQSAAIANLGPGEDNWIFQVAYREDLGGDPKVFRETIQNIYGSDTADTTLNWERSWNVTQGKTITGNPVNYSLISFSKSSFNYWPGPFKTDADYGVRFDLFNFFPILIDETLYPVDGDWIYRGNQGAAHTRYNNDTTAPDPGNNASSRPGGSTGIPLNNPFSNAIISGYQPQTDNSAINVLSFVSPVFNSQPLDPLSVSGTLFTFSLPTVSGNVSQRSQTSDPGIPYAEDSNWGGIKANSTTNSFAISFENTLVETTENCTLYLSSQGFAGNIQTKNSGDPGYNPATPFFNQRLDAKIEVFSSSCPTLLDANNILSVATSTTLATAFTDLDWKIHLSQFPSLTENRIEMTADRLAAVQCNLGANRSLRMTLKEVIEYQDTQAEDAVGNITETLVDIKRYSGEIHDGQGSSKSLGPGRAISEDFTDPDFFVPGRFYRTQDPGSTFGGFVVDSLLGTFAKPAVVRVYLEYLQIGFDEFAIYTPPLDPNYPESRSDVPYESDIIAELEQWVWDEDQQKLIKGDPQLVQLYSIDQPEDTSGVTFYDASYYRDF